MPHRLRQSALYTRTKKSSPWFSRGGDKTALQLPLIIADLSGGSLLKFASFYQSGKNGKYKQRNTDAAVEHVVIAAEGIVAFTHKRA